MFQSTILYMIKLCTYVHKTKYNKYICLDNENNDQWGRIGVSLFFQN